MTSPVEASATRAEWTARQHRLNLFTDQYLKGVGRIREDGSNGPATQKRIGEAKYWLGWLNKNIDGHWNAGLHEALVHPERQSDATRNRGKQRRAAHNRAHYKSYLKPGVTTFDGVRVAKTAVPIMEWCREVGYNGEKWDGHLVSGYRDPAYSQSLCIHMCGHPTCPGKCAGLGSNHVGNSPARFAIDVSSYAQFKRIVAHCPLLPHIHNELPVDPVHFSPSGR